MTTAPTTRFDEIVALDAEHVMDTYARAPVAFVRGDGTRLWDSEGREYLDFLSGLAVTSLGHAHPVVADALADQARTLTHVSNLYYNDLQPRLAVRLDALLGGGGRVFFSNSGAEANECAIKLARRHRPGGEIVVLENAFHGRTMGALSGTPQREKQEPFAAVLSCADSRVPVEIVFDQTIGHVFVTRVAGNVATAEIIGSLEYGVAVLGTRMIMVLGHGSCGATAAGRAS